MSLTFQVVSADAETWARVGMLRTPHGEVPTPAFMPVGTQATVKTMAPRELEEIGASIVLANTYHLYLRPGAEVVAKLGGLHRFMGWPRTILTDSGGFQVFSLSHRRKLSDEGVVFKSHVDGSEHLLTPEKAIMVQEQLGADIIMALDECTPPDCDERYAREAMERTHRWAQRSKAAHVRADQALFGISQGGMYPALRRESAKALAELDFPGYGIGGLSVGEAKAVTWEMLEATMSHLPADKPRYMMGVGSPEDLFEGVARGVDMFDCVLPTRIARNGALLTRHGRLNIRNAKNTLADGPIEDSCQCYTCCTFSLAYLRHLFQSGEILGLRLATTHNLYFLLELMREIRTAILEKRFTGFKDDYLSQYEPVDEQVRLENKRHWLEFWGRGRD
ncbi:MAG: tRNA guanosine(34) transglycosylase Tgt [Chloroflexota bacterium]